MTEVHDPVSRRPEATPGEQPPDGASNARIVELMLRDALGRRLRFDEVGSGVGYLLPVLLALASEYTTFVQQPELHVHPALQSDLGDAFLLSLQPFEESNRSPRKKQHIIETHSEHLLLRLFRRIRQTANSVIPSEALRLEPDQLTVLYIDPQGDGSSRIHHLHVSRGGDFMDRWPRGFFEERWQDLFDE